MLLMLFNFGVLRTLLTAWAHLPSMARFETLGLPFMRAFVPIMPAALLVAYLGLQMEALRRRNTILIWVIIGAAQFVALASFPYATLMMAGITSVSAIWQVLFGGTHGTRLVVAAYGLLCAVADVAFVLIGSPGFYSNHQSAIQFQPSLFPLLVDGNWLILASLTAAVTWTKRLAPEVRWPLVGLGTTNLILMLGDALVPAKPLLVSHHAAYFIHTTIAILFVFSVSTVLAGSQFKSLRWKSRTTITISGVIAIVVVNGFAEPGELPLFLGP